MRFRKKPVVIEAVQYRAGEQPYELAADVIASRIRYPEDGTMLIDTLEGVMIARPGDWVIRGVKGELYPCKPDIFAATYEPADASDPYEQIASLAKANGEVGLLNVELQLRVQELEAALRGLLSRPFAKRGWSREWDALMDAARAALDKQEAAPIIGVDLASGSDWTVEVAQPDPLDTDVLNDADDMRAAYVPRKLRAPPATPEAVKWGDHRLVPSGEREYEDKCVRCGKVWWNLLVDDATRYNPPPCAPPSGGEPATPEPDIKCAHCGQMFFGGDLSAVLYHEQVPHQPIAAVEWSGRSVRIEPAAPEPVKLWRHLGDQSKPVKCARCGGPSPRGVPGDSLCDACNQEIDELLRTPPSEGETP